MNLTEYQCVILIHLKESKSINRISAKTVSELLDILKIVNEKDVHGYNKNLLDKLLDLDLVSLGLPDGRSRTYYITPNGVKFLNTLSADTIDSVMERYKKGKLTNA